MLQKREGVAMSFVNARIAVKFPFIVVTLALLTGLATGLAAHLKLSADLEASAKRGLAALRESRQAALESQLQSIRRDLRLLASSVLVRDALQDFNRYRAELGDRPDRLLRKIYIDNNPYPPDRRLELDHPRDGSRYSIRHSYFHPWFRVFLQERGYHDIFLFNRASDLIYSVAKEDDFGTNFQSGPWADSALGRLVQVVNGNPEPGLQLFSDFEVYGPSGGAPASFIAAAVYDGSGAYIGVLALQVPSERIDRVMQVAAGMGRTGESYIIGSDLRMQSNSRFVADPTVLRTKVDTEVSWRALAGETGVMVVQGRSGATTVSAYGPLDFMGTRWGVIAEIEQAELLQPLAEATRFMLVAVVFILILAAVVGIGAARGLSRPIVQITAAMRRLAEGDLDVEVRHTERGDEIGEMARALGVFKENARKRQVVEAELARKQEQFQLALDYMPGGMFMLDADGRIVVVSKSYPELFEFPEGVMSEGGSVDVMLRYQAQRGDYGPGIVEDHIAAMRRRLFSNESTRYQRELTSGRVLELHVAPAPARGAVVVAADITERVRAEAALRASQQALTQKSDMLEAVLSSMDQGLVAFDGDLKLAAWNNAYFKIREYPAEYAVIGRPFEDFVRFDIARAEFGDGDPEETLERVVATARRAEPHTFERMRPNGRWIEVRGGPFAGVGFVSTYTDITERKRADEAVRRSEERLLSILRESPVGVALVSANENRFAFANSRLAEILGFEEAELVGRDTPEIFFDARDRDALIHELQTHGRVRDHEARLKRRDGTPFWGLLTLVTLEHEGEAARLVWIYDITKIKDVESALAEKEAQLRAAMDYMPGGMCMVDDDLRVVVFNNQIRELFNFPEKHFRVGESVLSARRYQAARGDFGEIDDDTLVADTRKLFAGGESASYERHLPDGRYISIHANPAPAGGSVIVCADITERRRAEEAALASQRELAEQRQVLESVLENTAQAIGAFDKDTRLVACNARYKRLLRLPDELAQPGVPLRQLTTHVAEWGFFGDGDREEIVEARLRALTSGEPIRREIETLDGMAWHSATQPRPEGGFVITYTDLTERKRAEEAVRRSEERLLSILRESPVGVALVSAKDNRFVFANSRLAEMFGFEEDELVGRETPEFFVDARDRDALMYEWQTQGRAHDHEARLKRSDGTTFWGLLTLVTLEQEGGDARLVWIYDITKIKDAEAALAEQRQVLESVLENTAQAIGAFDRDTRLVACNARYKQLLRLPDELAQPGAPLRRLVTHLAEWSFYGEGDKDEVIAARLRELTSGEPLSREMETPDGMAWHSVTQPRPEGGFVVTFTDLTERKEAERRLEAAFAVISDSIDYASRIQRAMLPPPERLDAVLPEHFVLWEPRDRVGGDIYWAFPWGEGFLVILADCTGHGVPGAFVTLIASGALALARAEIQPGRLSELVQRMHQHVQTTLGQNAEGGESDDGLELGAIYIGPDRRDVTFVGARFRAFVLDAGGLREIPGTRAGLGYRGIPQDQVYEARELVASPGTRIYITTDGLTDQIGGDRRRMFGKKRLKCLIEEVATLPLAAQKDRIIAALRAYQGDEIRRDDVSMIGLQIGTEEATREKQVS
jgi:PAS domain S-box-containing protein